MRMADSFYEIDTLHKKIMFMLECGAGSQNIFEQTFFFEMQELFTEMVTAYESRLADQRSKIKELNMAVTFNELPTENHK